MAEELSTYLTLGESVPGYILNGKEFSLPYIMGCYSDGAKFSDGTVSLTRTSSEVYDDFWQITSEWKNISNETLDFIFIIEATTAGQPYSSIIPCVMYNENKFGSNGEPKGLTYNGRPWIFGFSRTGLPSATVTESEHECVGLFASADDPESLVSSCSLVKNGNGTYSHRIYYPEIELPVAYTVKNKLNESEPILNYITLAPGETFTSNCYLTVSEPKMRNFGIYEVYSRAYDVFDMRFPKVLTNNEVWDRAVGYAKESLAIRENGYALFRKGYKVDENGKFYERPTGRFEIGWCGQNASFSLAMITDYLRNENRDSLNLGIDVIDTWVSKNGKKNGFSAVHFNDDLNDAVTVDPKSDVCNLSWAALQVLASYSAVKNAGIEKESWKNYGLGICDFLCDRYSNEFAFGMLWDENGMVSGAGSAGVFATLPLIEAYKLTNEQKYLDFAEKALEFYDNRDLKNFTCTAGALDTSCVDKETCWPFMHAANELYRLTRQQKYLDIARRAGIYLLTWVYMYDVPYEDDSEFSHLGFRTKGSTAVSVEHCHLDPWGSLIAYDFDIYYSFTGDRKWLTWAKMLWNNSLLGIAPRDYVCHGIEYRYGAQAEGFLHTNWVSDGEWKGRKGTTSRWFVAWPSAFRLCVLTWDRNFLKEEIIR